MGKADLAQEKRIMLFEEVRGMDGASADAGGGGGASGGLPSGVPALGGALGGGRA